MVLLCGDPIVCEGMISDLEIDIEDKGTFL